MRRRHPASGTEPRRFIRDTRFGTWLITSDVWTQYVLSPALSDLVRLLDGAARRYATILDIGCGGGKALALLEGTFAPDTLIGIDPDPDMIERSRAEIARRGCRADLRVGAATALDLRDGSVDLIFCHQTFHHIAEPEEAAREFHRVLCPGGVLLFAESCAPFIRSLLVRLLFRHPMDVQRLADEYVALLRASGFAFTNANVATPYPWWCRPDLGALEWLGWPVSAHRREERVLNVVAFKRGSTSTSATPGRA